LPSPATEAGGVDSLKTRWWGCDPSMSATRVDPHRVSGKVGKRKQGKSKGKGKGKGKGKAKVVSPPASARTGAPPLLPWRSFNKVAHRGR
jgi:hypothetical protein